MSLYQYTIKELVKALHKGDLTVEETTQMSLDRIKEVDNQVKAFVTVDEENALAKARKLDESTETKGKLFGVPNSMKDNIMTKGLLTTCSSNMLANFEDPLYNATLLEKLNDEQSVMIGKVNMDEFAMGSTTETSAFHPTYNPWHLDHVPGGSSGGSAASVAAGEVMYSIGTDTGGSIRQPAAFCGVIGMKPTYGLVSRCGLVSLGSSLDQAGPITRTVEDNAYVLETIAGHDELDAPSAQIKIPKYTDSLKKDDKGLKIAVPKEFLAEGVSEEVRESIMNALKMYELLGATWEEVSLPHLAYADAAYNIISNAEASSSLARFDGVRYGNRAEETEDMIEMLKKSRGEGFGDVAKRRILFGTTMLSSGYRDTHFAKAQQVRTLIKNDFEAAFKQYDIIIGPTTSTEAFKIGEDNQDSLAMQMNDILTVPVNLAGLPAISVPCGYSDKGLPFGIQIIGKHFDESTVYQAAYAYEQATNHHKKRPDLGGTN